MTNSFIQIIKLGCQFTFTVYVLCCCLALAHYFWYFYILNFWAEAESEEKEGKHFFATYVMIVKWHVASLWFLYAWNGWFFPHEKKFWLQLKKDRRCFRSLPDSARLHGCGYGHSFVDVIGKYSRNQTIICVVGSFYHFLDSFEFHDLLDRPKNL